MEKHLIVYTMVLLAVCLQSCKPSADGMFDRIQKETGLEVKPNHDYKGSPKSKSGLISIPFDRDNTSKVETIKNSIDNYLNMMPNEKYEGLLHADNKAYYRWEDSEKEVIMRVLYKHNEKQIMLIFFFTEK